MPRMIRSNIPTEEERANIVCIIPIYSSLLRATLSRYGASGGPPMPKRPAVMPETDAVAAAVSPVAENFSFLPPQKKNSESSKAMQFFGFQKVYASDEWEYLMLSV